MATKSWPYVSIDGDRKTTAADEAKGYDMFVGSGVVPGMGGELAITKIADTMSISIADGNAVVAGRRYIQDTAITLNVDPGSAQPRIDIIALESNANTPVREARFVVVKGTPAFTPQPPSLTNDAAIQQQEYARLVIPAGAANLNSATLTDKRAYASGRHSHAVADVANLQSTLDGKAEASHTHSISNVSGLQSALDGKANAAHGHTIANVSNLQSALDGKATSSHGHTIDNVSTLRSTLDGLYVAIQGKQDALSDYRIRRIMYGFSDPVDGQGSEGDIYLKLE
jgi:hypothetical protein